MAQRGHSTGTDLFAPGPLRVPWIRETLKPHNCWSRLNIVSSDGEMVLGIIAQASTQTTLAKRLADAPAAIVQELTSEGEIANEIRHRMERAFAIRLAQLPQPAPDPTEGSLE